MAQLIIGVILNVLIHVFVEHRERPCERRVAIGELGVLLPQILLEQLSRGQEPQDSYVAWCHSADTRLDRCRTKRLTRGAQERGAGHQKRRSDSEAANK